ncbi:hypothetical protein GCM10011342_17390 [Aquisalinus flavus]|uniref:Uncharacterized protein n=1 Tax=Aquisalinus flavus TaxID=1526572 RepID=A0A8J2V7J4_9PROT|nr:hypothetical protein GCM10011342_17390 [Aquisalinus flavus]
MHRIARRGEGSGFWFRLNGCVTIDPVALCIEHQGFLNGPWCWRHMIKCDAPVPRRPADQAQQDSIDIARSAFFESKMKAPQQVRRNGPEELQKLFFLCGSNQVCRPLLPDKTISSLKG